MYSGLALANNGFGLDVPYTTSAAKMGVATPVADNGGKCGNSFALQQMLVDLGYDVGGVDGQIGSNTMKAMRKFSENTGAPYVTGTFPKAAFCQALMDAWSAKKGAPAPVATTTSPIATPASSTPAKAGTFVSKAILAAVPKGTTVASTSSSSSAGGWWGRQSTGVKAAVVGGGVLAVVGIAWAAAGRSASPNRCRCSTPNRRRRRR